MSISVGELQASLTLNDMFTKGLELAKNGIQQIVSGIIEMGVHGADVDDASAAFDNFQERIGNTGDVLGTLRTAFGGTISDMDMMGAVNKNMALGLQLTETQFGTAADAARILADQTGGKSVDAFNAMNMAMATGRERGLKSIGLEIDHAAAQRQLEAQLGKTADAFTAQEKIQVTVIATMAAAEAKVKEFGKVEDDFGDKVAKANVFFTNFYDQASKVVASSPALAAGMDAAGAAFNEAFGGDQKAAMDMIAEAIKTIVIIITYLADGAIYGAQIITVAWYGLQVVFNTLAAGLSAAMGAVVGGLATVVTAAEKIPGVGDKFKGVGESLRASDEALKAMTTSFAEQAITSVDSATKTNEQLEKMHGVVGKVRDAVAGGAATNDDAAKKHAAAALKAKDHAAALEAAAAAAKKLQDEMKGLIEGIQKSSTEAGIAGEQHKRVTAILAAFGVDSSKSIKDVTTELKLLNAEGPEGQAAAEKLKASYGALGVAVITVGRNFGALKPTFAALQGDLIRTDEQQRKVTVAVEEYNKKLDEEGKFQTELRSQLNAGIITLGAYEALGGKAITTTKEATTAAVDWAGGLSVLSDAFQVLGVSADSSLMKMIVGFQAGGAAAKTMMSSISDAHKSGGDIKFDDIFKSSSAGGMSNQEKMAVGMGAVNTAMTAYKSGALGGAVAGAQFGASFGPWGAAIGGAVGGLLGFIGSAAKARAEMKKLSDEFKLSHGGLDELKKKALETGVSIEKALNAKSPKEMKAAIEEANKSFALWDKVIQANGGSMDKLKLAASAAGVSLQAALSAKSAAELGVAITAIQKQLDDWNSATKLLDDTMKEYGITVDQMGPKFRAQELDKQAIHLYEGWQVLLAAGASWDTIVAGMGPKMNEYVNTAVNGNMELSKSNKPIIDEMFRQGKLLHENGDAYTEAEFNALKYGTTQTEAMMSVVESIKDLIAALTGIPREITTDYNFNQHNTTTGGDNPNAPPPPRNYGGEQAAGGDYWVTRATTFVAGERGPERATFTPQGAAGPGGGHDRSAALVAELKALRRELPVVMLNAMMKAVG
jgi:hypothetical protein